MVYLLEELFHVASFLLHADGDTIVVDLTLYQRNGSMSHWLTNTIADRTPLTAFKAANLSLVILLFWLGAQFKQINENVVSRI